MRFFTLLLSGFALFAVSITGCSAQSLSASDASKINAVMALEGDKPRPGYAIGVVRHGKFVFEKGYGAADLSIGKPITAATPFNLASLSKQFTAGAIALELQEGTIGIDDQLIKHWPEIPSFMRDITIGHLVYMTSGLPEYYSLPSPKGGWMSEDQFTVDDAINAVFSAKRLNYAPGSEWSYSNINYQLLAGLVARLNDKSFSSHMTEVIFTPLQMANSWVDDQLQSRSRHTAKAYVWNDQTDEWRDAPRLSPHYGGSGVFASVRDLAKWDEALFSKPNLGPRFKDIMLSTKQFDHDKTNDAFGLVHGSYKGHPTIWYEGGDYGVSTFMIRLTDEQTTIICLANFGTADCRHKAMAIADIILKK